MRFVDRAGRVLAEGIPTFHLRAGWPHSWTVPGVEALANGTEGVLELERDAHRAVRVDGGRLVVLAD